MVETIKLDFGVIVISKLRFSHFIFPVILLLIHLVSTCLLQLHEAIAREESQEFKEGIVTQEFRRGFLLGNRLLRPAMVKVSSGPGSKQATVATENSSGQPATTGVDER